MAQKPLLKGKKAAAKHQAANRHGKVEKQKKGKYAKAPRKASELARFVENKELSKAINKKNLEATVGVAAQSGGSFKVLAAPPVAATAQQRAAAKGPK